MNLRSIVVKCGKVEVNIVGLPQKCRSGLYLTLQDVVYVGGGVAAQEHFISGVGYSGTKVS